MNKSIRALCVASLLAGSALAATPAFADDSTSDFTISGNAALVTDYRFRGVGLSDGDIAVQGGIDVSHSSGFYVGTWGSSLGDSAYGHTEVDIYGGWSGDITDGLTGDIGVIYYAYPNGVPGADLDYIEVYGSLGYTIGPVDTTFGIAYAPDQDALGSEDNLYLYGEASVGIPNTPLTVKGHVGYTDGILTYDGKNGWDWSVGADFAVTDKLSLGVAYTGVDGTGKNVYDDAVVGTLSVSF